MILIIVIILIAFVVNKLRQLNKDYAILAVCKRIKTLDGKPLENSVAIGYNKSIFHNTFDLISSNAEEIFYHTRESAAEYKRSYVEYILGCPLYNVIDAKDAELVLNDSRLITKGFMYKFLDPFIKTGLLTSTDKKWHDRRKLLTPAFHFNILGKFMEIFKRESEKFVDNLNEICKDGLPTEVTLDDVIPRFTLNTICETALGVSLDDCAEGDRYRENIKKVEESFVKRVINPFFFDDFMYKTFGDGVKDQQYLEVLHAFTSGIIKKRRELLADVLNSTDEKENNANEEKFYCKQRFAMLDTMLRAERDNLIDHAGICEEVDTFVFEGFDTTSMNLVFALMNFALHPEKQQRCYEEIVALNVDLTTLDTTILSKLKYLECCIKETQRLYPSVPGILRECVQDTALGNNLLLPKGTQVAIHIFDVHRNDKYFENPDEFIPERFLSNEQRHPYAFIPFSAGQRNCIGQKFAMLEVKTLLVYILKNFKVLPETQPASFRFLAGILIRSRNVVKVKFVKRLSND